MSYYFALERGTLEFPMIKGNRNEKDIIGS